MKNLPLSLYTPQDIVRAKRYWRKSFAQDAPQMPPVSPHCVLSILVPVYGEDTYRLRDQLRSFSRQTLAKKSFEVVYVVNNGPSDGTQEWRDVYKKNQDVLQFLKNYRGCVVRVIDCSSKKNVLQGCTVGKARNIGVAEVSCRYFAQGRDGILFQTDADTSLRHKRHLQHIFHAFRSDSRAVGAAGGVIYEFSPDSMQGVPPREFLKRYHDILLYFRWSAALFTLHTRRLPPPVSPMQFSGMHMISRAIASACIGGVLPLGKAEDVKFGESLGLFAKKHRYHILPMREKWYVTSALRDSFRTDASFGKAFERIREDGGVYASPEDAPLFHQFLQKMFSDIHYADSLARVRSLLHDDVRPYRYSDAVLLSLFHTFQKARGSVADLGKAYVSWRKIMDKQGMKNVKPFRLLFSFCYPPVRITRYRLAKVKKIINAHPEKRKHLEAVTRNFQRFLFKKQS